MFSFNDPVVLTGCREYDYDKIKTILKEQIGQICPNDIFTGKKVVIKPNLVRKMSPDEAATTHPIMLKALISVIREAGGNVLIAESPGGIYSESTLSSIYRVCGIDKAAKEAGAELNYSVEYGELKAPEGEKSKVFNIIKPILDADVIINLSKLKTHGLTTMSAAVKNLFGTIPGIQKFEMHARFSDQDSFCGMLTDLCYVLHQNKTIIDICDAIVGMEGNGPTGGSPREIGCILSSTNPYNLDLVNSRLIGFDGKVDMLKIASDRGYCPKTYKEVCVIGDDPDKLAVSDFVAPDAKNSKIKFFLTFGGGAFKKYFEPRPLIDTGKCIGCGVCAGSCPEHTIELHNKKSGGKVAYINAAKCIKCYCCQELCPHDSVKIKMNFIISFINKIR